jgi:hypothetical protein
MAGKTVMSVCNNISSRINVRLELELEEEAAQPCVVLFGCCRCDGQGPWLPATDSGDRRWILALAVVRS